MAVIGLYFKNVEPPMRIEFDSSRNTNRMAIRDIETAAGHEKGGRVTIVDILGAKHLIVLSALRMVVELPE